MLQVNIRETNPLLGVTGRCCPQLQGLCEDACVLRWSSQPIGIGLIQRYVADWEHKQQQHKQQEQQKQGQKSEPSISSDTGKKVAVIGAGPSGLAAAELLKIWTPCYHTWGINHTAKITCPTKWT